jgi:hypothetical protein
MSDSSNKTVVSSFACLSFAQNLTWFIKEKVRVKNRMLAVIYRLMLHKIKFCLKNFYFLTLRPAYSDKVFKDFWQWKEGWFRQ